LEIPVCRATDLKNDIGYATKYPKIVVLIASLSPINFLLFIGAFTVPYILKFLNIRLTLFGDVFCFSG
jgi:hypothetical protein